jgi:glycosyltransferase involved in cell wall biosynthesis
MKKVVIIQAEMKRYRVPFFIGLHNFLQQADIELKVLYSNSNLLHAIRQDSADLPEPVGKKVSGNWFFGKLLYQDVWRYVMVSDLIIVGPEIKYLLNPFILFLSAIGLKRVAFWGLGPNRHPGRSPLAESIKQLFFNRVDWWFAYTETIAEYLRDRGMPAERITNVQNATDTNELRRLISDIGEDEARASRESLTGMRDPIIGLYCGLIGAIKSLPLLIEAARIVKASCPNFHLMIVGNGPDRAWLENTIREDPWIHYLGSRYGREGALCYRIADVFVLSGTAGLAVVDSFAAGLPLLATQLTTHPPEITYVIDGDNGLLAAHDAKAFAASITSVVTNPELMRELKVGARKSGNTYTMEAMVDRFGEGVLGALSMGRGTSVDTGRAIAPSCEPVDVNRAHTQGMNP